MITCRVVITGFVQGVGFRQHVKKQALALGLTGWVENKPDKTVEAFFQSDKGSKEEDRKILEEMIEHCKKGSPVSAVEDIEVEWLEEMDAIPGFEVI
jgi:acylphosphatase